MSERAMRELARRALERWGLAGADLTLIKIRENAVYAVTTPSGLRYALRIHRAGYHSDTELRSELQWMQALQAAGIEVPRVIPSTDRQLFVSQSAGETDKRHQIDLFEWVDGTQLGNMEQTLGGDVQSLLKTFHTLGVLAAQIHNQAVRWAPPPGYTRHAWDIEGIAGENPLWGHYWELGGLSASQRRLMRAVRERLYRDLTAYGQSADNYSMIHADLVPENVLVNGQHVRIIDFDDAGFGWHLFEIVTSLYFHQHEADFGKLQDAVIAGYRSTRPLPDHDIEHLPLFYLARATTYLGWVHTRPETETAQTHTPTLIDMACSLAEGYLS